MYLVTASTFAKEGVVSGGEDGGVDERVVGIVCSVISVLCVVADRILITQIRVRLGACEYSQIKDDSQSCHSQLQEWSSSHGRLRSDPTREQHSVPRST